MWVVERRRLEAGAEKGSEIAPADGQNRQEMGKRGNGSVWSRSGDPASAGSPCGGIKQPAEKPFQAVIPSGDFMILRLTTLHENALVRAKSSLFNKSSGYFHGSEESCSE